MAVSLTANRCATSTMSIRLADAGEWRQGQLGGRTAGRFGRQQQQAGPVWRCRGDAESSAVPPPHPRAVADKQHLPKQIADGAKNDGEYNVKTAEAAQFGYGQ